MKRGVCLIGLAILLCGCEQKKTLVCTKNSTSYGVEAKEKIAITFDKYKVKKTVVDIQSTIAIEHQDQIKAYMDQFLTLYEKHRKENGVKVDVTQEKNIVRFKMSINPWQASEKITGVPQTADLEETKQYFKRDGYQCKQNEV